MDELNYIIDAADRLTLLAWFLVGIMVAVRFAPAFLEWLRFRRSKLELQQMQVTSQDKHDLTPLNLVSQMISVLEGTLKQLNAMEERNQDRHEQNMSRTALEFGDLKSVVLTIPPVIVGQQVEIHQTQTAEISTQLTAISADIAAKLDSISQKVSAAIQPELASIRAQIELLTAIVSQKDLKNEQRSMGHALENHPARTDHGDCVAPGGQSGDPAVSKVDSGPVGIPETSNGDGQSAQ